MDDTLRKILDSVKSLDRSELTKLRAAYLEANPDADDVDFASHLLSGKKITGEEYKEIAKTFVIKAGDVRQITAEKTSLRRLRQLGKEGQYSLIDKLNEGAMGEIFLAKDRRLGRIVAYKKINKTVAEYPTFVNRFILEAQITARLEHPGIIPIYDLLIHDDLIAYAMKLVNGITLGKYIEQTREQYQERGKADEKHILRARLEHFLKVCDAVHYAHRKGVVHRDLKPINIMIGRYHEVYVMDWGIAKLVSEEAKVFDDSGTVRLKPNEGFDTANQTGTQIGHVMGTLAYMSPEQAKGRNDTLNHLSDVYSLGLILFEVVMLQRAIQGDTEDSLYQSASLGEISPIEKHYNEKGDEQVLMHIIKKATQYLEEERYQTVELMANDIRRFLHGEAVHAVPGNEPVAAKKKKSRKALFGR